MNQDETKIAQVLTRAVAEVLPNKDTLIKLMTERKIKLFLGIDPTGNLLHLGHSIVLRKLQQFAELGHEVILLIGNGTVKIGDPTGKDSTRPMLTNEEIEKNWQNWQKQASKILDFNKIKVVRNDEWLSQLKFDDIIKLMAKVTVQQLLERDMFQERMKNGNPIHAHEIMYPLLQGYDSVHMAVDLEVGGTDQTFNMMMGRTLLKSYKDKEKWVLTTPIINGTDGRKMSKSYNNYVALTENHIDMYGKLMRVSDNEIISYLTLLTDIELNEINEMEKAIKNGENPMQFKKRLAFAITKMYHDENLAQKAAENFEKVVQNKEVGETKPINLTDETELSLIEILKKSSSGRSFSEIRRLIEQGGVTIYLKDGSEEKPTNINKIFDVKKIDKIKLGKREFYKMLYDVL